MAVVVQEGVQRVFSSFVEALRRESMKVFDGHTSNRSVSLSSFFSNVYIYHCFLCLTIKGLSCLLMGEKTCFDNRLKFLRLSLFAFFPLQTKAIGTVHFVMSWKIFCIIFNHHTIANVLNFGKYTKPQILHM